jgi:hypothetical protein
VALLRQCLQQLRAAYPQEPERVMAVPYDGYFEAGQLRVLGLVEGEIAPPPPLRLLGAPPRPTHTLPFQITW